MNGERYELYFGSLKVGIVTQTDIDFPNLWGDIVYDSALSKPQAEDIARFVNFVALNRESTRLVDMDSEGDTSREQSAVNAELEAYMDYVESEDWRLIDQRGRELPILCPILRASDEIVWRWNPGQDKQPS
jgi:hypothetical protein